MRSYGLPCRSAVRHHRHQYSGSAHNHYNPAAAFTTSCGHLSRAPGLFPPLPTKHNLAAMLCRSERSILPSPSLPRSMHYYDAYTTLIATPNIARTSSSTKLQMTSSSSSESTSTIDDSNDNEKEEGVNISIEYCSACRWMLRSTWIASELLTTFAHDSQLASVTMIPCGPPLSEGGIFRVSALDYNAVESDSNNEMLLWDRKVEGRFPESKEVKQLVRDCVDPDKDLGHSDNSSSDQSSSLSESSTTNTSSNDDCVECKEDQKVSVQTSASEKQQGDDEQPPIPAIFEEQNHVSIEYSTGSNVESSDNGLYRATYYANELLSMIYERNAWWKKKQQQESDDSIEEDDESIPAVVNSVKLVPNRLEVGILRVKLNDSKIIHEQSTEDATTMIDGAHLRYMVKDVILNGDSSGSSQNNGDDTIIGLMDDDEAEEARKFFGVF